MTSFNDNQPENAPPAKTGGEGWAYDSVPEAIALLRYPLTPNDVIGSLELTRREAVQLQALLKREAVPGAVLYRVLEALPSYDAIVNAPRAMYTSDETTESLTQTVKLLRRTRNELTEGLIGRDEKVEELSAALETEKAAVSDRDKEIDKLKHELTIERFAARNAMSEVTRLREINDHLQKRVDGDTADARRYRFLRTLTRDPVRFDELTDKGAITGHSGDAMQSRVQEVLDAKRYRVRRARSSNAGRFDSYTDKMIEEARG